MEYRIHLEGAMAIGHRLPLCDGPGADLRALSSGAAAGESEKAARELRKLLGTLLTFQERMGERHGIASEAPPVSKAPSEDNAWTALDARVQPVLDWALGVADEWKEKTRLDVRKSFKVLDQSFGAQMQALVEMEPTKLRKRCTPPPGRHRVYGLAATDDYPEAGEKDIYDDREFYVQLLREVLSKGEAGQGSRSDLLAAAGDGDEDVRAEIQGRRAARKRARADVERRASKGRKIRYVAIEKLQNFTAPRPRMGSAIPKGVGPDSINADASSETLDESAVEALMRALFSTVAAPAAF